LGDAPESLPGPVNVVWELTLACNLRCAHCGSSAGVARDAELSAAEALALCRDLAALGSRRVTLMGGEPLLRDDWDAIARALSGAGVVVELLTNGHLLDDDAARRIVDACVHSVSVSIDGTEEAHDGLRRRRGSYRAAMDAVARVRAAGLPVGVVTQVNRRNAGVLRDLHEALVAAGVQGWQVQLCEALGRGGEGAPLMIEPADLPALERDLVAIAADGRLWTYAADSIGYMSRNEPRLRTSATGRQGFFAGCQAGVRVLGVTSDGRVRGCLSLPAEFDEGSVRERPLAAIWADPDAFAYNRRPRDPHGFCATCPFGRVCRGGCSSLAWSATGRLGDNPYCLFRVGAEPGGSPCGS
jgi:radical SAM protein with 4Fe4S-binding SPASM domain